MNTHVAKVIVTILIGLILPWGAFASERGISATPFEILEGNISEWPHTTDILLTNASNDDEWIEVAVDSRSHDGVIIEPSRFAISGAATARITVTFDEPLLERSVGTIRISATRKSPDGLVTGIGIEIPFAVATTNLNAGDLRAAVGGLGTSEEVGGAIDALLWIITIIGALWIMIAITRRMSRR